MYNPQIDIIYLMMTVITVCFGFGYIVGKTLTILNEQKKVIDYCLKNDLNMTSEVIRDLYPNTIWDYPKHYEKDSTSKNSHTHVFYDGINDKQ